MRLGVSWEVWGRGDTLYVIRPWARKIQSDIEATDSLAWAYFTCLL